MIHPAAELRGFVGLTQGDSLQAEGSITLLHLCTPDPDPPQRHQPLREAPSGVVHRIARNPGASRSRKVRDRLKAQRRGATAWNLKPGTGAGVWVGVSRWQFCVSSPSWNIKVSCHPPLSPSPPPLKPLPLIGS